MNDFSNILGRKAMPKQLRPRLSLAAVSANPSVLETLGHLAISRRDSYHAVASAKDLAELPGNVKLQVVLIGGDLSAGEYEATLRVVRERHGDAAAVAMLSTDAPCSPSNCDFALPTPAVADEYERALERALSLVEARRAKKARTEFRQQLAFLLENQRAGVNGEKDSVRRVYVAATMTLFQILQVKNLTIARWQRPDAPVGEFSWGLNERWAGVEMPGLANTFAKSLLDSRLVLDARRGPDQEPLLKQLAGQSVCIVPGVRDLGRDSVLWIAGRSAHQPFDIGAVETLRFIARSANETIAQMTAPSRHGFLNAGVLARVGALWQTRRPAPALAAA